MIKKIIFIVITFIFMAQPALAHRGGGPPYFKVNDSYAPSYPIQVTSVADFVVPLDMAPANYLVNEKVDMAIDMKQLFLPVGLAGKLTFDWDFGDGTPHGSGESVSHSYKKMGSFVITINAADQSGGDPQMIETCLINILPNADYKLPELVITVNDKQTKDPVSDPIRVEMKKELSFDASQSREGSAKIESYYWDLTDGTASTEKVLKHNLSPYSPAEVSPVLRVKDVNGFYADAYVWLKDEKAAARDDRLVKRAKGQKSSSKLLYLVGFIILAGLGGWWLRRARQ